jgi:hypothetical protein
MKSQLTGEKWKMRSFIIFLFAEYYDDQIVEEWDRRGT